MFTALASQAECIEIVGGGVVQTFALELVHDAAAAHDEDAALRCLELYDFDTVLFPFNWFMNMAHGMGSRLIKAAKERNMGVLCMKAFIERTWDSEDERSAALAGRARKAG